MSPTTMDVYVEMCGPLPSASPPSSTYKETAVDFPLGRGKNMPSLLLVDGHPQWPHATVVVVVYDFNETKRADLAAQKPVAPLGLSHNELKLAGWYKREIGEVTFVRQAGGEPADDVFYETMFDSDEINGDTNGGVDEFNAVMREVLGEQSERGASVPERDANDVKHGGIFFERGLDRHLKHSRQGLRCYGTMTSTQYIRGNLVAPSSNMKGPPDPDIDLRKRLNEAGGKIACAALRKLPKDWAETQAIRVDVLNTPVVGCRENRGLFSSGQLNVAHAVQYGSKDGMQKDIGRFGKPHRDRHDAAGGQTVMTCYNDLPPGSQNGHIFFTEVKIYREQVPGAPEVFNGRHFHVASPPQLPHGMSLIEWAYRCTFILYPSLVSMGRSGPIALSHGPDIKVMETDCSATPGPLTPLAGNATFVRDGLNIMAKEDRDTFVIRELYASAYAAVRGTDIEIDQVKFFEAFSVIGPDGDRIRMEPWPLGPGGSQEALREQLLKRLTKSDRRQTPFIVTMNEHGPAHGDRLTRKKKSKRDKDGNEIEDPEEIDDRESDQEIEIVAPARRSKRIHDESDKSNTEQNSKEAAGSGLTEDDNENSGGGSDDEILTSSQDAQTTPTSSNSLAQTTAESNVTRLSSLIQGLHHDSLSVQFKDLRHQLLNQTAIQPSVDLSIPMIPFNSFENRFETNPLSYRACQMAVNLSTHIIMGTISSAKGTVNANLYRAQVMFAHWRLWIWFIHYFEPALDEQVLIAFSPTPDDGTSPPKTSWLENLVNYMHTHAKSRAKACKLPAADIFGRGFSASDFPVRTHTSLDLEVDLAPHVTKYCEDAVTYWLGFGSKRSRDIWRLQGAVVGALFYVFKDSGVLLSSTVWKAYHSPESFAFPPNSQKLSSEDQIDQLCESLYALRNEDRSITSIFAQFGQVNQERLPQLYSSFHAATNFPFIQAPSHLQKSAEAVVAFMRDLYPIICKDASSYSKLCDYVMTDPDKFSPFRETAPSRSTIISSQCFAPETICTQVGFFNALVFRAVTYGAKFLRKDGATYFHSVYDFHHQVAVNRFQGGEHLEDKYVCDPRAYGTPTNRFIENVPLLWVQSHTWEAFIDPYLAAGTLPFFDVTYKWLLDGKFKGVGELTAYLLTVDLVYAKVVLAPSPAMIGHIIIRLGKGPFNALKHLGIIGCNVESGMLFAGVDGPHVQAFVELHRAVDALLIEQEKEYIGGYDVMILEHALCKLIRTSSYHAFGK